MIRARSGPQEGAWQHARTYIVHADTVVLLGEFHNLDAHTPDNAVVEGKSAHFDDAKAFFAEASNTRPIAS